MCTLKRIYKHWLAVKGVVKKKKKQNKRTVEKSRSWPMSPAEWEILIRPQCAQGDKISSRSFADWTNKKRHYRSLPIKTQINNTWRGNWATLKGQSVKWVLLSFYFCISGKPKECSVFLEERYPVKRGIVTASLSEEKSKKIINHCIVWVVCRQFVNTGCELLQWQKKLFCNSSIAKTQLKYLSREHPFK